MNNLSFFPHKFLELNTCLQITIFCIQNLLMSPFEVETVVSLILLMWGQCSHTQTLVATYNMCLSLLFLKHCINLGLGRDAGSLLLD